MKNTPFSGLHEQLAAERRIQIRETLKRLDHLERDAARQAGQLLLIDGLFLVGTTLLMSGAPGAGTLVSVGLALAVGISAFVLALAMGFALFALTGAGLLSGIIVPAPPGSSSVDFNAVEADSLITASGFSAAFLSASREELIKGTLEAIARQRGTLARQAGALRFCRIFLLLGLVAWLVGLAFRLLGLF